MLEGDTGYAYISCHKRLCI